MTTYWEKNGVTKAAERPAQEVRLKWNGYAQVDEPSAGEVAEVQSAPTFDAPEPTFADAQSVFDPNGDDYADDQEDQTA